MPAMVTIAGSAATPSPETLRPETPEQLLAAVRWAVADESPLDVAAAGSKRGFGRPVAARARLDLSALAPSTLDPMSTGECHDTCGT